MIIKIEKEIHKKIKVTLKTDLKIFLHLLVNENIDKYELEEKKDITKSLEEKSG